MAQIVGQVELQVVPNDSTFNRDLQRIIDKAPKLASQNLTPSLNTAAFEASAKTLSQTAQVAGDQATQALGNITPGLNTGAFQQQANQVAEIADEAASKASVSFSQIAVGVGVGAAALYGLKAASDAVIGSLSGLFDNLLKAKAGFESILGQTEGNKLLTDITEFARVTPFATEQLVQYSQQLLGVGRASDSIIPTLRSVGDLVASKGGDTQTISRVLFTLTQIQSVGRLIGQDTLQLQSALIPITQLLAKNLGKTQQEVKALQAAGKITSDQVFSTLEKAGLDVAGAMEGATRNIGGAKEALKDTVKILFQQSPVLIKLNEDIVQAIKNLTTFIGSDRVSAIVADLSSGLEELYTSAQPLFGILTGISADAILTTLEAVLPLIKTFADVLSQIPVPVLTAVAAFLAFNKFTTFVEGFGAVTKVLNNFGGVIGRISSGLNSSANAFQSQGRVSAAASTAQQALVRTYQAAGFAAAGAATQTEAYTAAMRKMQAATQAAVFAPPTAGTAVTDPGRQTLRQRAGAALGNGSAIAGAAGIAGVVGLSQRDNVDGVAGQVLGVGATAATAAALGFQVGGPYGAAIGAAAGLGFGIFQELNKKAREDAEAKAKEWGEIGAKSAKEFIEGFNRDFDVSPGGGALASERIIKSAQIAADVATLKQAAETGIITDKTKAAADRLDVDIEGKVTNQRARAGFGEVLGNFDIRNPQATYSQLAFSAGFGEGEQGQFIDQDAFKVQIADIEAQGGVVSAELKNQRKVVEAIIGDPIAAKWFDDIEEAEIAKIAKPFGKLGELLGPNFAKGLRGVLPFDIVGRSLESTFDRLQKFGIGVEEALKLGEKTAFYFSEILASITASVDASFKWNAALDEAKATIESLNKERVKEASTRIAQLQTEEDFAKRIKALNEETTPIQIATIARDALTNAGSQAAFEGAEQGLAAPEVAARERILFATSIQDVQQQTGLNDETLKAYLTTAGLYDDYIADLTFKNEELAKIEERLAVLRTAAVSATGRSAGAVIAETAELKKKRDELNGIVTAETLIDQARERRNAAALSNVKATEALQGAYSNLATTVVDGTVSLGQFGDVATQAFARATALGTTPAEDNQIFVDSIENIQLALGLTDDALREYLESVGLLDAYNKAVVDSSVGVTQTVDEIATKYGYTNEEIRTLLGLLDIIPNDVPIYLTVETTAAFAALTAVDNEIARLQGRASDPSLTFGEGIQNATDLEAAKARKKEIEAELTAAGVDVNSVVGARKVREQELADAARKKEEEEAARKAKEFAAALDKAAREAEAWQNKVDSAANTISSAMENAARAVEDASVAWQQSIKERVQYESAVSVGRLTRNAQGQTKDLKELDAGLSNLRGRGVSQEVLDSLGIDNVDDLKQVRKLVKANDSDLAALTQAVGQRDEASLAIAKNEEDKRTRENITTAVIAAAVTLGFDVSKDQAASISNQFTITPGTDYDTLTDQILSYLSSGKIAR